MSNRQREDLPCIAFDEGLILLTPQEFFFVENITIEEIPICGK